MEEAQSTALHPPAKKQRQVYPLMLLCLASPLVLLCFYALSLVSADARVGLVLIAILEGILSGCCCFLILKKWEKKMQQAVAKLVEHKCRLASQTTPEQTAGWQQEMEKMCLGYEHQIDLLYSSVAKSKDQVKELNLEMDKKLEQMRIAYLEFEDLRKEYHLLEDEYRRYQADIHGQLGHKDSLIEDYQKTIGEQREVIEKKQRYVEKLEGKVRDLMYEIRSLLQLEDPLIEKKTQSYVPDVNKGKPYDFSMQLTRFLEMAESFMGADHLGGRFLNSGAHRYAIDVRPLFDKLSNENHRILFVYSPIENRFLFISDAIRHKLGWSADKMMKEFSQLVVKGLANWKQAMESLEPGKQQVLPLSVRHKSGEEVEVDCYMGLITKGPCMQSIMGMFV